MHDAVADKLWIIAPKSLSPDVVLDKEAQDVLCRDYGFERVIPGKLVRKAYRCRVNGDGFRYWAQELVTEAGRVVGSIDRHDLGSEEI